MSFFSCSLSNGRFDLWNEIKKPEDQNNRGFAFNLSQFPQLQANGRTVHEISFPFFYWSSQNRHNFPTSQNALNYGAPFSNVGKKPDASGRIIVSILEQDRIPEMRSSPQRKSAEDKEWKHLERASNRITAALKKREGFRGKLFRTFIPISTRTVKDGCKSLFPWTGWAFDRVTQLKDTISCSDKFFILVFTLIDIVTLSFRLLSFIPRLIYQHSFQKNLPASDIQIIKDNSDIDWSQGLLQIHMAKESLENNVPGKVLFVYLGS